MSVKVYKKDGSGGFEFIPPEHLQYHLDAGWTLTPEPPKPMESTEPTEPTVTMTPVIEEANGLTSNEAIRETAKTAGIEHWKTANIKTLKQALTALGLFDDE